MIILYKNNFLELYEILEKKDNFFTFHGKYNSFITQSLLFIEKNKFISTE
jgi:hypothetical protein